MKRHSACCVVCGSHGSWWLLDGTPYCDDCHPWTVEVKVGKDWVEPFGWGVLTGVVLTGAFGLLLGLLNTFVWRH
jgi:hypothetical protein